MRSCARVLAVFLSLVAIVCAACGGGAPRSQNADVLAINQPTPDPTLDAVVRDLPKSLAGVPPTPTPTAISIVPKPVVKQAVPAAPKPAVPKPAATEARAVPTEPKLAAPTPRPAATPSRPAAPVASPTRH